MAALVLLVVLAGIGAVMARLSALEQAGSSLAVLGARGDWAARSGIEWAMYQAVSGGGCPPATTLVLGEGVLQGFQVDVSCTASVHREGSRTLTSLSIRSRAQRGAAGSREHVYREVRATLAL